MTDDARGTDAIPDGRDESANERLDRHWNEILQELRVVQAGSQILTGFLLAIAFQSRFSELDPFQIDIYLVLVILAALITILGLAPVSLHRILFRRGVKENVVKFGHRVLLATTAVLSVLVVGVVFFLFDFVLGLVPALIAGGAVAVIAVFLWLSRPLLFPGQGGERFDA